MKARRDNTAFTLIELLVVIAIIAVLAALLIPITARSLESGRASVCLGQTRSIATATLSYADDHQGALPTQVSAGFTTPYYTELLRPYLPGPSVWLCPSIARWTCPNDRWRNGRRDYLLTLPEGWGGGWPSYGANDKHVIRQESALRYTEVAQPSRVYAYGEMLFLDWGLYPQYFVGCPIEYQGLNLSYDIHLGGNNVAFLDGHVALVHNERMKERPTAGDNPWLHPFP